MTSPYEFLDYMLSSGSCLTGALLLLLVVFVPSLAALVVQVIKFMRGHDV